MLVEVPAVAFYAGTIALVIVSGFLIILLFYLIKAARLVISLAEFLEEEGRAIRGKLDSFRRALRLMLGIFR